MRSRAARISRLPVLALLAVLCAFGPAVVPDAAEAGDTRGTVSGVEENGATVRQRGGPLPGAPLQSVEVALWPEFDRPGMLVIEKIRLAPSVRLPARLAFRIPAAAGTPNAVAEQTPEGQLVNAPYERSVQGEWAVLDVTASGRDLHLEYYEPIDREGELRRFTYVWPDGHPVDEMIVSVQQPPGARNLETEPAASGSTAGTDGLRYHEIALGRVAATETAEVTVSYSKPDDALTVESAVRQGGGAPPADGAGTLPGMESPAASGAGNGQDPSRVPPWVFGLVAALAVIGGAAWWIWHRRRGSAAAVAPAGSAGSETVDAGEKASSFCTRCGAPARSRDRFCHACGHRLDDGD